VTIKSIPAREARVCDFCGREALLNECWVCGREFCLTDEGTVQGSYGFTRICRDCADYRTVESICQRYARKLAPIFAERDRELKRLRRVRATKKPPATAEGGRD
jgi:hypothetical protein